MTKTQTGELVGVALDWAVAKCHLEMDGLMKQMAERPMSYTYRPSTDWFQGGAVIEREGIALSPSSHATQRFWYASQDKGDSRQFAVGPTPLIAAMRCYVIANLGGTVEVPKGLLP